MKRILTWIGAAALSCALLVACDNDGDVTGIVDDDGDVITGTPSELVIARQFDPLLANGIDDTEVSATVVDSRGRGLGNIGVRFTTTHGTIEPFATTNNAGLATTTLTSVASVTNVTATVTAVASTRTDAAAPGTVIPASIPSDAIVIVSRKPLSQEAILKAIEGRVPELGSRRLTPAGETPTEVTDQVMIVMKGITVALSASPSTIPADGLSTSRIRATVTETVSRVPLQGQEVRFGATAGTITGSVTTDASGSAVATLTGTGGANSTVTAFYGKELTAATTVNFSAITLDLSSARASLTADGVSTTSIVARLLNAENNPVRNASVNFTTSLGVITSPVVTDENGEAVATLTAADQQGTATVTANFAASTQTLQVTFTAPPVPSNVIFALSPSTVEANGSATSRLSAQILDGQGNPMPDGVGVTFAIVSGGGTIVGPVQQTEDGTATTTYVAGTTPGPVVLRATSGAVSRTAQLTLIPLGAGGLTLTAASPTVLADGLASTVLTVTATDAFGNPVAQGTRVSFETSLGEIEAVTPTNVAGVATARLRAGRFETGLARVTASIGDVTRVVDVNFVSEAASHIVLLELDRPSIGVQSTGSPQTATLTFEVRDRFGIPVDATHAATVSFLIVPTDGLTDATLAPVTATTNDRGRVATTVRSGTISGAIEVLASIGSIRSQPIRVVVHGDLPDPAHFSISFERLNIHGLVLDGIRNGVTARVADQHGNPVPDSTAVWFSTNYGIVQGSAFTDAHGEATVWEVTAGPHPPEGGGNGLVLITAQTLAKDGNRITTSGNVMWSGHTILEVVSPATFDVPNGGSVTITFRVRDANNNPLTGGTTIAVEATEGNIGPDQFVVPDTQSPSYTTYTTVLSDDDRDEDEARAVTVTVTVTSQNGNATTSLTGILR